MMSDFDSGDFLMFQEEDDFESFEGASMKKEKEYVELNKDSIEMVAQSLRKRSLHLADVRRIVSNKLHPSIVHITWLAQLDMHELVGKKKEANQLFAAKKYKEALDKYDNLLLDVVNTCMSPQSIK